MLCNCAVRSAFHPPLLSLLVLSPRPPPHPPLHFKVALKLNLPLTPNFDCNLCEGGSRNKNKSRLFGFCSVGDLVEPRAEGFPPPEESVAYLGRLNI